MIAVYCDDVLAHHARPKETAARLDRVLDYFGEATLAGLNAKTCRDYVAHRGGRKVARRELEDLRAAIRHHWREGLCTSLVPVVLPERSDPRERHLTRAEAARLLRAAWRLRERQGYLPERATARHVARFILVGLYTGTRAGAICGAGFAPAEGRGWLDLEHGVFYRRPAGRRETKKRQPPIRIPPRLLAHLRRWHRLGIAKHAAVEWNGKPVKKINKAFRAVRAAASLGPDVIPHTLRHTAATWLAQSGAPIWQSAGFLGMSVATFERVYGHHHPDHQAEAVNALSGPRRSRASRSEGKVVALRGGNRG